MSFVAGSRHMFVPVLLALMPGVRGPALLAAVASGSLDLVKWIVEEMVSTPCASATNNLLTWVLCAGARAGS